MKNKITNMMPKIMCVVFVIIVPRFGVTEALVIAEFPEPCDEAPEPEPEPDELDPDPESEVDVGLLNPLVSVPVAVAQGGVPVKVALPNPPNCLLVISSITVRRARFGPNDPYLNPASLIPNPRPAIKKINEMIWRLA